MTHRGNTHFAPIAVSLFLLLSLGLAACGGKKDGEATGENGQAKAAVTTASTTDGATTKPEDLAQGQSEAKDSKEQSGGRSKLPNVEVMRVQPRNFTVERTYIGHLAPIDRIELRAEVEGSVEKASFEEGQRVNKGTLLMHVGTSSFRIRRNLARSNMKLAQSNYKRDSTLRKKNLIAQSQLDLSRNQLDSAKFSLELAELDYQKSVVSSPIAGIVKTRALDVGEFARKGELMAEILNTDKLKVLINVPEKEISQVQKGSKVNVTMDAMPGRVFPGRVRQIGLEADQKNRSFPVEVVLENSSHQLRSGMLGRVGLQIGAYDKQVLIPRHAVLERERNRVVFVVKDDVAIEREILLGVSQDGEVQVVKGITFGEALVIKGQQKLAPNENVKVVRSIDQSTAKE